MNPNELIYIDMQDAEDVLKLEYIRKILSLPSLREFSVICWNPPCQISPDDASYVLVKQFEQGIGFVCSFASYERKQFWDLLSMTDVPIDKKTIIAWAYLPYDNRVSMTGELKA